MKRIKEIVVQAGLDLSQDAQVSLKTTGNWLHQFFLYAISDGIKITNYLPDIISGN